MTPSNRRICIAHSKDDAENIVTALDAADRKKAVIKSGMGDYQQAIIDKQSAELEYLRGFALVMLEPYRYTPVPDKATYYAKNYGLIDENSNPTPLLMGE